MPTKKVKVAKRDADGEIVTENDKPVMVETGQVYEIDGKKFTWHPDAETDQPLPDVVLPLRMKLKLIREFADRPMDADARAEFIEKVAPGSAETVDEMDLRDFDLMYATWQTEYENLSGATLGE